MIKFSIILPLIFLTGCSSFDGTAHILTHKDGVMFTASRPTKMTMIKDGVTYTYDSQAPSLLSRILSAMTLGAVGGRK